MLTRSDSEAARTTAYTYDKNNRVTKIVYAHETTEGDLLWNEYFQYDSRGNLAAKLVGMESGGTITVGSVTAYQYDMLGRLTKVRYNYSTNQWPVSSISIANGHTEYSYDGSSSLRTSMVEKDDGGTTLRTSSYQYDLLGRLERYTPPLGLDSGYYVSYTYNNLGQKTAVRITNGAATPYNVGYDYFANGWLKSVRSGTSTIASYDYDAAGNRQRIGYGNGTYMDYTYDTDPRYRLNSIGHYRAGTPDVELAAIDYGRDDIGSPTSMTDWTGSWSYGYDENNRLTSATPPSPIPSQPAGGVYGYDWVGNRLNPPAGVNHMVYNKADQLTLWPGMYSYTYDGAGNLQYVKNPSGSVTLRSYSYTPAGLLASASYGGRTLTNTWDADSNRVALDANGSAYEFVYDTTAGIPAVIEESTPGGVVYYIREPGGSLIARVAGSDIHYYHFDELGSTRLLTDASGTVTDRYAYDAYGSLISHDRYSGSIDQPYQYVGQLGYYTHYSEPEFGLLQLGVRFYNAEVGRFGQRDPARDGMNLYSYVNDRATIAVDPNGLRMTWGRGCSVPEQNLIRRAAKELWRQIKSKPSGCFWDCMREFLDEETTKTRLPGTATDNRIMPVHCFSQRPGAGNYGYCTPTLGNAINLTHDAVFGRLNAGTSLGFILCHEMTHVCRHQCHSRTCRDNDEAVTNSICETLYPGQTPPCTDR